jgi:hypothetical protein
MIPPLARPHSHQDIQSTLCLTGGPLPLANPHDNLLQTEPPLGPFHFLKSHLDIICHSRLQLVGKARACPVAGAGPVAKFKLGVRNSGAHMPTCRCVMKATQDAA